MQDKKIIVKEFKNFLREYGWMYDEVALTYIKENFWNNLGNDEAIDILLQIYNKLGLLNNNLYKAHLNKIESVFDIKRNILEVGGGFLPSFGEICADRQIELGKGTITVFDPELLSQNSKRSNLLLIRDEFTSKRDITNFDMLVGIYPCAATERIIRQSCKYNKDFYIAMCGCTHFEHPEYMHSFEITPERYQEHVINEAQAMLKKYNNGELVIDKLEGFPVHNCPILYNKKF